MVACAAAYALWFLTGGSFQTFPPTENLYLDLSDAFLHGQVALLRQPEPALLALSNPYNVSLRAGLDYLWDASYYQGKYYLYWGPVPALLFAGLALLLPFRPPAQAVILLCYVGLAVAAAGVLLTLRKRLYPRAPLWSVALFVLAAALNLPHAYLLGRTGVYETSILAGQCFLFLGVLAWLRYLDTRRLAWIALSSLAWGLAVGSRYNLVLSAAVFGLLALLQLCWDAGTRRVQWRLLFSSKGAAFVLPLVICALALACYNFARFGSLLETGLNYQLTIQPEHSQSYAAQYVPSNLYTYLFYPARETKTFPFLFQTSFTPNALPAWAAPPPGKIFDEIFTGMLPRVPVLWLLGAALFTILPASAVRGILRMPLRRRSIPGDGVLFSTWVWALALAAELQFGFLMFYYYGAMRFMSDFTLPLALLAAVSAWWLDNRLRRLPILRIVIWFLAAGLAIATALIGFFAAFDVPPALFQRHNPLLYAQLTRLFGPPGSLVRNAWGLVVKVFQTLISRR